MLIRITNLQKFIFKFQKNILWFDKLSTYQNCKKVYKSKQDLIKILN